MLDSKKQKNIIRSIIKEVMDSGVNVNSTEFKKVLDSLYEKLLSEELNREYYKDDEKGKIDELIKKLETIIENSNATLFNKIDEIFNKLDLKPEIIVPDFPEIPTPIINVQSPEVNIPDIKVPQPKVNVNVPDIIMPEPVIVQSTELPEYNKIDIEYDNENQVIGAIYQLNGKKVLSLKVVYDKKGNPVSVIKDENDI